MVRQNKEYYQAKRENNKMNKRFSNTEYKKWLQELKTKIKSTQIKAALSVNAELIQLYWEIGKMIVQKQKESKWGSKFVEQLSKDLKKEFPNMNGFSRANLYFMKQFFLFYYQDNKIVAQLGRQFETSTDNKMDKKSENSGILRYLAQIPWKHNILIIQKSENIKEALFYINKTIENNWSRSVLEYQIETDLYRRQGKAVTNFKNTLPEVESDLAQALLKDPYNFDFIMLSERAKEKDLENELIQHITGFLLELGKGFAYLGRQYKLKVGEKEFFTDLLFYHTKLKSYVVIELKMKEFQPEFIGKLNFYITAINETVKDEYDKPTIGILLCKTKDNIVVDFSIKDINKPIGVSEFSHTQLPENIRKQLPTETDFKQILNIDYGKTE